MKCRALSSSNNIIWFGKTGKQSIYWLYIPDKGIKGYQEDNPDWIFNTSTISGAVFASLVNTIFADLGETSFEDFADRDMPVVTINNHPYILIYDYPSVINGKIYDYSEGEIGNLVGEFSYTNKPVLNYSEDAEAIADSLTQRLSVIKGELWYQVNFGLPLTEKHVSPSIFDMVIIDIITSHPGVATLESFTSQKSGHTYSFNGSIQTIFGEELTISESYSV